MPGPNVLFLCTGNSARSQMAEALLRRAAGDRFNVYSAGLEPKPIHPLTLRVMEEIGADMSAHRSKSVNEYLGRNIFHHVIIVCDNAQKHCPSIFPGMRERLFWPFEDPVAFEGTEEEKLAKFREVRDQIQARIETWLKGLK
ncbi:MAG: arsenate reductase ArsC [Kiritimatiellae bacterium]|nr:arsenate reductase ArsC [Kiritimatiellia bacterium]